MKKVKSSQNRTNQVETGRQNIENMPSEELALMLDQQYQSLMVAQQNIQGIKGILGQRYKETEQCRKKKETTKT